DSAERALVRAGVALRRRHRPSGTYATLKGAGSREGELHSRPELEVRVEQDDAWPEAVLAALPEGAAAGLAPIAELWVERVRLVARSEGAPVADIAFDAVECRAPGHEGGSVTFNEVEVEALHAGPESDAALGALAYAVGTLVPLTPASHSKLERALALLGAFAQRRRDRPAHGSPLARRDAYPRADGRREARYLARYPPSTGMYAPWTNDAASLARNSASAATSSGSPRRPIGCSETSMS